MYALLLASFLGSFFGGFSCLVPTGIIAFSGIREREQDTEFVVLLPHTDGSGGWGGWERTRGGVAEGGFAQAFRSSKGENSFFAQELIPLFSHTARKFFSRSAPNLSSCG